MFLKDKLKDVLKLSEFMNFIDYRNSCVEERKGDYGEVIKLEDIVFKDYLKDNIYSAFISFSVKSIKTEKVLDSIEFSIIEDTKSFNIYKENNNSYIFETTNSNYKMDFSKEHILSLLELSLSGIFANLTQYDNFSSTWKLMIPEEKPYYCSTCKKRFSNFEDLISHITTKKHEDEIFNEFPFCNKVQSYNPK